MRALRGRAQRIAVLAAVLLPSSLILRTPIERWERVALQTGKDQPVYAVAAETDRQRLRVATRYRGAGPQGFRNYVALLPDALAEKPEFSFKEFALSRRLQPVRTSPTCPVCRVVPAS